MANGSCLRLHLILSTLFLVGFCLFVLQSCIWLSLRNGGSGMVFYHASRRVFWVSSLLWSSTIYAVKHLTVFVGPFISYIFFQEISHSTKRGSDFDKDAHQKSGFFFFLKMHLRYRNDSRGHVK